MPCVIYNYKVANDGQFVVADSVVIPHMDTNSAQAIDPKGPTSIRNLSGDNGVGYRVAFKKELKKWSKFALHKYYVTPNGMHRLQQSFRKY